MRPAIAALRSDRARRGLHGDGRVFTFSLNQEDGTGDPFDQWMAAIDDLIAASGAGAGVLVGVSFGGLIATRYAAHHPDRVGAVILVSTPSPRMRLTSFDHVLIRHPVVTLPLFAVRGMCRLVPEVMAAKSTWSTRLQFAMSYGGQALAKPVVPRQMARWVHAWQSTDLVSDCGRITAPTRIITGERDLDRVVPVDHSLAYLNLIPGATAARLARTGHVGLVSRPHDFSALISEFLDGIDDPRTSRPH